MSLLSFSSSFWEAIGPSSSFFKRRCSLVKVSSEISLVTHIYTNFYFLILQSSFIFKLFHLLSVSSFYTFYISYNNTDQRKNTFGKVNLKKIVFFGFESLSLKEIGKKRLADLFLCWIFSQIIFLIKLQK